MFSKNRLFHTCLKLVFYHLSLETSGTSHCHKRDIATGSMLVWVRQDNCYDAGALFIQLDRMFLNHSVPFCKNGYCHSNRSRRTIFPVWVAVWQLVPFLCCCVLFSVGTQFFKKRVEDHIWPSRGWGKMFWGGVSQTQRKAF